MAQKWSKFWPKIGGKITPPRGGGNLKLLVEIFLSCEKFEKFDYQTFWSGIALGQPEKFDFQTFRRKSQKFAQKVKSLKIKLFWQKSLIFKLFKLFDKNFEKFSKKVKSLKIKLFWQKSLKIKLFGKFFKKFDFQTFWSKIRAEKVKSLKIKLFKLFEKNSLAEKSLKTFQKVWKINFCPKNRLFLD